MCCSTCLIKKCAHAGKATGPGHWQGGTQAVPGHAIAASSQAQKWLNPNTQADGTCR